MDIRQLQNFVEVCKYMSFTRASQNLFISQQGMSKSIKTLENELGVNLFIRNKSTLSLTDYGSILLKYAKKICDENQHAIEEINQLRDKYSSDIRLGVAFGLANFMPERLFSDFKAIHPDITLTVIEFDDYALDTAIAAGEIDIALCIDPVEYDNIIVHCTHEETTYYMLSESHPLADRKSIDLRDMKGESFITFGNMTKGHTLFGERCHKAGFTPKQSIITRDMQLIYKFVRAGMGVGFFVGDPNTKIEGIKIIPDMLPNWKYRIDVCTAEEHNITKAESDLIRILSTW